MTERYILRQHSALLGELRLYFGGFSGSREAINANWRRTQAEAHRMTRGGAYRAASVWGPDWREVVRVVRLRRRGGG
jgi:hypothetical protein